MEKKKLFYVMRYPLEENYHLKTKFDGQMRALEQLGFDVFCIAYDRQDIYIVHHTERERIGKTHFGFPNYIHTLFFHDLHAAAMAAMKKYHINVLYWRSAPTWRSTYAMLKQAKKQGVMNICEVPTYLVNIPEKPLSFARKVFGAYSNYWEKQIADEIDYYLLCGDPAPELYRGKAATNIDNGISPEMLPVRQPRIDSTSIRLLCLASMSYWHGYDRLIRSLANYQGPENVVIHMVGGNEGGSLAEWKRLVTNLGLTEHVVFHGPMYGDDLTSMFDLCDVGICSLGAYRKGLDETSELKAREFISRGLPFVTAVKDPLLTQFDQRFRYELKNDDSTPDMQGIVAFALKTREVQNHPQTLRQYAIDHMTWKAQYEKAFSTLGVELT